MKEISLLTKLHSEAKITVDQPSIRNLAQCVEDVKKAALDPDSGPSDPTDFQDLRKRLETASQKLPPLYREAVFQPYVKTLDELGAEKFTNILAMDPEKTQLAGLMLDIAQAILQNGEGYLQIATDSFQEVVSDIYDGFLSAEDRTGVKPPDKCVIPPLVKWGNPGFGPYTWTVESTATFGLQTAIVSLPPANAHSGLLAWSALGHETGGHDILHADSGCTSELKEAVWYALTTHNIGYGLPDYWATRIDETASDILGILNMGPAAGIGLIGYFRGLNAAYLGEPVLRSIGPQEDPHPADILRGFLAAAAVGLLDFSSAQAWEKTIAEETNRDLRTIQIAGKEVPVEEARESAGIIAAIIMQTKLNSLENHALAEIQNWRDQDEEITHYLSSLLTADAPIPAEYKADIYASHVVAAAVSKAIAQEVDIPLIFNRMQSILKVMHDRNPSWGPLYVQFPGNLVPHVVYHQSTRRHM